MTLHRIKSRSIFSKATILCAALSLCGCSPSTGDSAGSAVDSSLPGAAWMKVWTDPETGCRYFIYKEGIGNASRGGMSIRFRRDGKPDCPEAVK